MRTRLNFSGVWTALITPFLKDKTIDWKNYEILLKKQLSAGVSGVVVCGSTGEATSLLVQEKLALIKKAKALVGQKIKIIAGTGSSNTEQTLELSKLAVESGADALLIVTPPYNKPNPQGLLDHFKYLAEKLQTLAPICLYHVPSRTGQKIPEKILQELMQIEGIDAIKESSADLSLLATLCLQNDVSILSGEDPLFLSSLAVGAKGIISVTANIFPEEVVALYTAFAQENITKARKIHQALLDITKNLFIESNPCPSKYLLSTLGLCQNYLRRPLAPITNENQKILQQSMTAAKKTLQHI